MARLRIDSFDHTDELAAPVDEVFAVFSDIARWPTWISVLSEAAPLSTGPLRVGFRLQMTPVDLGRPVKTTLIDYEANRVLAWGLRSRIASLVHTCSTTPSSRPASWRSPPGFCAARSSPTTANGRGTL